MTPIETTKALLPNADGRITMHYYSHREPLSVPMYSGTDGTGAPIFQSVTVDALMFRCGETGALRQWGYE